MKIELIGADPEGFLHDGEKFISAIGRIGGTKKAPLHINEIVDVQEDNVAFEFNIKPAKTSAEFAENIKNGIDVISDLVFPLDMKFVPTALFDDEELANPDAHLIGCDPDFSVYGGGCEMTEYVENRRFAAGHIHIGYENPDEETSKKFVPFLDLHVGVLGVLHCQDTQRRQYYGRAGSIRLKSYGLEYRVPSNWWLNSSEHTELVFNQAMKAQDMFNSGVKITDTDRIQKAINNSDVELAKQILSDYTLL